jgi:hypothetical protein
MSVALLVCNLILVLLTLAPNWSRLNFLKPIWMFSGLILKLFPYIFAVPFLTYSLGSAIHNDLLGRAASIVNVLIVLGYLVLHEFLNESLKFKESDFCNRRLVSFPLQFILVFAIGAVLLLGTFYGSIAYLFRAAFTLSRLYSSFEYRMVQRLQIFHSLWQGYVALITLMG